MDDTLPKRRRGILVETWRSTGPLAVRAPRLVVASRGVWLVSGFSAAVRCVFCVNGVTPKGSPQGIPPGVPPRGSS